MNTIFEKGEAGMELKDYIRLLYDQALVLEGSKPKDPAAFFKAIAKTDGRERGEEMKMVIGDRLWVMGGTNGQ